MPDVIPMAFAVPAILIAWGSLCYMFIADRRKR